MTAPFLTLSAVAFHLGYALLSDNFTHRRTVVCKPRAVTGADDDFIFIDRVDDAMQTANRDDFIAFFQIRLHLLDGALPLLLWANKQKVENDEKQHDRQ